MYCWPSGTSQLSREEKSSGHRGKPWVQRDRADDGIVKGSLDLSYFMHGQQSLYLTCRVCPGSKPQMIAKYYPETGWYLWTPT